MNKILEIDNLSKLYRYGTIGTGSMRQDMNRWWQRKVLRKETNFYKGQTTKHEKGPDYFWALKDISFEVNKGDVIGIIGPNGAGKSTLLKIISRITKPTAGTIRGRGKINSLLEVGTGFQAELTGRENIFTSGHILGMKKREIRSRFDEIVEFSGVSQFIDTPVKRYSSGMYMRLAFAVAAHLDPDILIVDEVLAVGDSEFQKKCLNKMQEVSRIDGRTIMFVSHNLQAVANLCNRTVWLNSGRIVRIGESTDVVKRYTSSFQNNSIEEVWQDADSAPGVAEFKMKSIVVKAFTNNPDEESFITVKTPISIYAEFWNNMEDCDLNVNFKLFTSAGECVFAIGSPLIRARKGVVVLQYMIPEDLLNNTTYIISMSVMRNISQLICEFPTCLAFDVEDDRKGVNYFGVWPGIIRPRLEASFYIKQPVEDTVVW